MKVILRRGHESQDSEEGKEVIIEDLWKECSVPRNSSFKGQ